MRRRVLLATLAILFAIAFGTLFVLKTHATDPLAHAPELRPILANAFAWRRQDLYKGYFRSSGAALIRTYPGATYELQMPPSKSAPLLRSILTPMNGWKIEPNDAPWFEIRAKKTSATGKVVCEVDIGDEGRLVNPNDRNSERDETYIYVDDPSNEIPKWRSWIDDHIHG